MEINTHVEKFEEVDVTDDTKIEKPSKRNALLYKISFIILLALVFLLPLVFVSQLPSQFVKAGFLTFATLIMLIIWAAIMLKEGKFFLPKNSFLAAAALIPIVVAISSLASGSFSNSFIGSSFEIGTGVSIILGIILMFLTSRILRNKEQIFSLYIAFFASAVIIALFQFSRVVFGPTFLSFGILTAASSNLIGKWNEIGVFFGLSSILLLITLESISLSMVFRVIAIVALAASVFFIGLVNFLYVSIAVCVFSLALGVYLYVVKKKVPVASIVVLLFSLLFSIMYYYPTWRAAHFPERLNPTQVEVSPSLDHTLSIAKNTLKSDPLFGSGPNRFQNQWFLYKPDDVNRTVFWNIDFSYGIGLIPTYLVTTGVLGFITWILFLLAFLWLGYKTLFSKPKEIMTRYLSLSSFFAALYLWVFNIIYVPSAVTVALTFIFTGVFIASLYEEGKLKGKEVNYAKNPKTGFLVSLVLIIGIVCSIALLFVLVEKTLAVSYFNSALSDLNVKGDVAAGEKLLQKSASLDSRDDYYRALVQVDYLKISSIASQKDIKPEAAQAQFQAIWPVLLDNLNKAITIDPTDYQNYQLAGGIYESVLPLSYPKAYELASNSYQSALKINPTNPLILLSLARLEAENKNVPAAKDYIGKALQVKNNYTDAIYLLSQLQVNEGDLKNAIQSIAAVAQINPTDPTVFFQLGYLEYAAKDYTNAAKVLEQAVTLQPEYANARYFLGLAYAKLGRNSDAIAEFVIIQKSNPDSQDVKSILANLRAGKAPVPAGDTTTSSSTKKTTTTKVKSLPVKDGPDVSGNSAQ